MKKIMKAVSHFVYVLIFLAAVVTIPSLSADEVVALKAYVIGEWQQIKDKSRLRFLEERRIILFEPPEQTKISVGTYEILPENLIVVKWDAGGKMGRTYVYHVFINPKRPLELLLLERSQGAVAGSASTYERVATRAVQKK